MGRSDEPPSGAFLLHCRAHGGDDLFTAGPGFVEDLRDQPTLTGGDRSPIHEDLELADPTLLEFDGQPHTIPDQRSETRCLCGRIGSCVAIDDSNIHGGEYSSGHGADDEEAVAAAGAREALTATTDDGLQDPAEYSCTGPSIPHMTRQVPSFTRSQISR
jgi:hypothetical protein